MPMNARLLRPTTGFSPASIPGLALWLDAAASDALFQNSNGTTPAVAPNDPVGFWRDRSGNNRHATQATAGSRPVVGSVNSRRAVNFDGTDDTLAHLQGITSNELTTFCVYRYDTLNGGVVFDYGFTNDNTNASNISQTGFLNSIGLQVNTVGTIHTRLDSSRDFVSVITGLGNVPGTLASLAGATAIHTAAASFGGTETRYAAHAGASLANTGLRFNGSIWSLLSLGSRRSSAAPGTASVFMDGQICEFLMYERNLPQSQRRRIEQYLATRWGITLAPQVANADAQDWVNRVYANGGTVSASTAAAVDTFCNAIEAAGIRDRFLRLNLFCGNSDASLNAVRTPLYRGASLGGTQLGNATDTNNNFVAGDYAETGASGGLKGNGSSKYLDTGVNASNLNRNSTHLGVYGTNLNDGGSFASLGGARDASASNLIQLDGKRSVAANTYFSGVSNNVSVAGSPAASSGHVIGVSASATDLSMYVSGSSTGLTATDRTSGTLVAQPIYIFANNFNGSPSDRSGMRCRAYSFGIGMTATQVSNYDAILQTFQTALSRNV